MRKILLIISGLMLMPGSSWAGFQHYGARLSEAEWNMSSSALLCRLSQTIPGYGEAEFSHRPKAGMAFKIHVEQAASQPGSAMLYSLPPAWRHYDKGKNLGALPIVQGATPFYLSESVANRIIAELEQGMSPTLIYQDWIDSMDEVRVSLSPLNFKEVIQPFRQCQQGLLPYTFEDVSKVTLMFDFNQTEIDSEHRNQLKKIITYYSQDKSIKALRIDGYTDSKGLRRVNLAVATQRAEAVKAYLVKNGVAEQKIRITAHEETAGKFSNRTEEGRSKNRRVEVSLIK